MAGVILAGGAFMGGVMSSSDQLPGLVVIDDDEAARHVVSSMIKYSTQVPVSDFASAQSALSFLLNKNSQGDRPVVDAIVCDIVMPGMSGQDFILELRSAGLNIPVMLLSGNLNEEALSQGLRLGAFDVLEKPCDKRDLIPTVEIAMSVGAKRRMVSENLERMQQMLSSPTPTPEMRLEIMRLIDEVQRDRRTMSLLMLRNHSMKVSA